MVLPQTARPSAQGLKLFHDTAPKKAQAVFQPFDIDVEQSLLATILADPAAFPVVAAELVPDDFYDPLHGRIFEKMLVLDELERPIGPLTLYAIMKNDPGIIELLADAGEREMDPRDYFRALVEGAQRVELKVLPELCRIVTGHKSRRDSYDALADAQTRLDRGDRVETSLTGIVGIFDNVALRELERGGSADLGDAFDRLNRELAASPTKDRGLMTGWAAFDKVLGGFQPDSFVVLAGRPGMGKSILATNLLNIAARQLDANGERIYDPTSFSLEMSQAENVARVIAEIDFRRRKEVGGTDPIHYANVRKNRLTEAQFERYILIGNELRELGIQVFDQAKMTMQRIRALARARAQLSKKRPFIVIDHLQIVEGASYHKGNRFESLTETTGLCKALAKQLACPVIGLSQLSRGVESREDKRPLLSDLRESGSIEQDADAVIFMYRPEYYLRQKLRHALAVKAKNAAEIMADADKSKGVLDLDIAKNRHGPVGDVTLFIDVASGVIMEQDKDTETAQGSLGFGAEPLEGLDDLAKRTGA